VSPLLSARMLKDYFARPSTGRATIEENVPITPKLTDFPADFVLRAPGRRPVGVFLGTSDNRVLEALFYRCVISMKFTNSVRLWLSLRSRARYLNEATIEHCS